MKKAILLSLSIFCTISLFSQVTLVLEPPMATGSADLDDISTNPKDVSAHATLTYNGTEAATFRWVLTVDTMPDQWAAAVCDVNFCYNPGTTFATFELNPGESSIMDVHAYPSGDLTMLEGAVPGVGTYSVKITEEGNPDNTVTGSYEITIVGNPIPSSLNELEVAQLKVFPNPASDYFRLDGPEGVESITLYNLLGRELANFAVNSGKTFDISPFPRGLY
ncbi:MAG: T9SS type A sorting domain-containing protein, partial [Saprospiraceae bacterium]|nr:T9SS type A sorting domain-containing protein [Saprospiraceae bacterium]